jgi:hypothetical protein
VRDFYIHQSSDLRFGIGEDGIITITIERESANLANPREDAVIEDTINLMPGRNERIRIHGINELIEYAKERK